MTTETTTTTSETPDSSNTGDNGVADIAVAAIEQSAENAAQVSNAVETAHTAEVTSEIAEMTAQNAQQVSNENAIQISEIKEWQTKTNEMMATMLESQARMMEAMEALSLALSSMIPQPMSEQAEGDTPVIAPANAASPSDPVDTLPVQQAEQAIEKAAQKVRSWI